MEFKGFRDLDCYKKGRELRMVVSRIVKTFPASEKYILTAQILKSSRSVTANMAEGYGRYTYTDTRNFFIISRGSVSETLEHLQTALDETYINDEVFAEGESICEQCYRLTNGYIAYLDRKKQA